MRSAELRMLLGLCATARPAPEHAALLDARVARMPDFEELVAEAEDLGIGPLAALHLSARNDVPKNVRLALLGLTARHKLAHEARMFVLGQAVTALNARKIDHLVVKGLAMALSAYPRAELRAMRDVDLLLREQDIAGAEDALEAAGFHERTVATPGRHEVVTRARTHNGFPITLDLHRRLGLVALPSHAQLPRQTLDDLIADSQPIQIGDAWSRMPSREDLLRAVFRHGFCLQLDEDRLRYAAIADLATAMEAWVDVLDWSRLRALDRVVADGLGVLHHFVPLSERVRVALGYHATRAPLSVGDQYWGWPRRKRPLSHYDLSFLASTYFPSEWWLRLRHGGGAGPLGLLRAWLRHGTEVTWIATRQLRGQPRRER